MTKKQYAQAATRRNVVVVVIVAIVFLLIANMVLTDDSNTQQPTPTPSPVTVSADALRSTLTTQFSMQEQQNASQAFVPISGTAYSSGDELIHVYQFQTSAEAEATKEAIGTDGYSIGTTMYDWIQPPHFYQKENLLVLYFGTNQELLRHFQQTLGTPFVDAGVE